MVSHSLTYIPRVLQFNSREFRTQTVAKDLEDMEKAQKAFAKLCALQPFLNTNLRVMLGVLNRQLTVFARQGYQQESNFRNAIINRINFTEMQDLSDVEIAYLQAAIKTPKTLANELANFVFYIEDVPTECLRLPLAELRKMGVELSEWHFKDSNSKHSN